MQFKKKWFDMLTILSEVEGEELWQVENMAVDIKGYRVFIASPRGLEDERQKFFDTIQEYNRIEALPVSIEFIPVGWEYTLPGRGRPQSLINEEVKICDYFVLALWDRWGTPPDKDGKGKYSSGSEEEYHVALDCYNNPKLPMKQIVALFKSVGARQLSDPGKELQKVLDFKREIEGGKEILFKTFEGPVDFEKMLRGLLGQWRRDGEQGKTAKVNKPEITPTPEPSGIAAEPEQNIKAETEQTRTIVEQAEKLADEGKATEAEEMFAKAVVNSGETYAYNAYGLFLARVGRLGQAQIMHEKALDIALKIGDEKSVTANYGNLGLIYRRKGELDKAEEIHKKALEIAENIGYLEGMANQYGNLGLIYYRRGALDKAEEMHKKSIEINERIGRQEGMARQYGNLGMIYLTRGELDKAEDMNKKALAIDEKLGRQEGIANSYGNLGLICYRRGALDKAEEMHKKSIEIEKKIGRPQGMARQYNRLGLIYKTRGELDKAEEMCKKSLEINERIGRQEGVAIAYGNVGMIYQMRGELDKAEEMLKKALEIAEKLGYLEGMAKDYGNLGIIYEKRGDLDKAEEMHKKSLEIAEKLGSQEIVANQYGNLGVVYEQRGDLGKAKEYCEKARDLHKKIGMPNEVKGVEWWIEEIKGK